MELESDLDPLHEQVARINLSMALKSPISGHRVHLRNTFLETEGVDDQTDSRNTPRKVVLVYCESCLGTLPPKLSRKMYLK